jgi:hypothetical protein
MEIFSSSTQPVPAWRLQLNSGFPAFQLLGNMEIFGRTAAKG